MSSPRPLARAAELGVTVPQVVAELAALDSTSRDADADEIAELDRRAAAATPGSRVPQERVVQWLRTWGTPGFRVQLLRGLGGNGTSTSE